MTIDEVKERLRKLIKKWREERKEYAESQQYGVAQVAEWHADALEKVLTSILAPDDGLREGLEKLLDRWADKAVKFLKGKDADCVRHETIKDCIDEAEELLAKTPDPWKPIEDAPRDGTFVELCRWNKQTQLNKFVTLCGNFSCDEWKDFKLRPIPKGWATHYRPLPAPPREGK